MIQLAMGISDGLQCGNGTEAIVSRGLIEGGRLGKALGAEEHSFLGIAGIGNIIASPSKVSSTVGGGVQTIDQGIMPHSHPTAQQSGKAEYSNEDRPTAYERISCIGSRTSDSNTVDRQTDA